MIFLFLYLLVQGIVQHPTSPLVLNSRLTCGGCSGVILDVKFQTISTQEEVNRWRFSNIVTNDGKSTIKILLVLPREGCQKVVVEKTLKEIVNSVCGITMELKASESRYFAIFSPSSKPVETLTTLYVVGDKEVKISGGAVSIYWPDNMK